MVPFIRLAETISFLIEMERYLTHKKKNPLKVQLTFNMNKVKGKGKCIEEETKMSSS